MGRIVFVDPQDSSEKFWWPAVVVHPKYYKFFNEKIENDSSTNDFDLVCYFEDGSSSIVQKTDVLDIEEYFRMHQISDLLQEPAKGSSLVAYNQKTNHNENDNSEFDRLSNLDRNLCDWLSTKTIKAAVRMYKTGIPSSTFVWMRKKQTRQHRKKQNTFDPGHKILSLIDRKRRECF